MSQSDPLDNLVLTTLRSANRSLSPDAIVRRLGFGFSRALVQDALVRLQESELVGYSNGTWKAEGSREAVSHEPARDRVTATVCALMSEHGRELAMDTRRCRGLLNDLCPERPGERSALVAALEEGVVRDLLSVSRGVPSQLVMTGLADRLRQQRLMQASVARWAVETWARALGLQS